MSEKREVNPSKGISGDKLNTIMKRFLSGKKDDPDIHKYYQVIDEYDYLVAAHGLAAWIYLRNKYDKTTEGVKYIMPLPKKQVDEQAYIENYPDIKRVFDIEFADYNFIELNQINKLIHIHESMHKLKPYGTMYHSGVLSIGNGLAFELSCNEMELKLVEDIPVDGQLEYHYDVEYMIAILKGLKDLKVDGFRLYYKTENDPLFFLSEDTEYEYRFAINRLLVRDDI